jgi:hypothetical protein
MATKTMAVLGTYVPLPPDRGVRMPTAGQSRIRMRETTTGLTAAAQFECRMTPITRSTGRITGCWFLLVVSRSLLGAAVALGRGDSIAWRGIWRVRWGSGPKQYRSTPARGLYVYMSVFFIRDSSKLELRNGGENLPPLAESKDLAFVFCSDSGR